jgi:hypothetical protein
MKKSQENIIKFIDAMINENYKIAHTFLGSVVEERIKEMISEATKKSHPFKKKGTVKDKSTGKSYEKTKAFGNRKQKQAHKLKNKSLPRNAKHKKSGEESE